MTSQKYYSKWLKEAERGHIGTCLSWGVFLLWMVMTMLTLSGDDGEGFSGIGNPELLWISVGLGLALGAIEFAYLFQTKKLDFYYSLPVKRETIFWTRYAHGLLQFLVPFASTQIFCALYAAKCDGAFAVYMGDYTGWSLAVYTLVFLVFYHLAVFAATAAGKVVAALLIMGTILGSAAVVMRVIVNGFVQDVFSYFYRIVPLEKAEQYFSPIAMAKVLTGQEIYNRITVWQYVPKASLLLASGIWAALLLGLTMLVWKHRKTEATGRAFVCQPIERGMEMVLSLLAGGVCTVLVLHFFQNTGFTGEIRILLLCLAGLLVAAGSHIVLEGLILRSRRHLLRRKGRLAVEGMFVILLTAGSFARGASFDQYQAEASELKSLSLCVNGLDVGQGEFASMKNGTRNAETDERLVNYALTGEAMETGLAWVESLEKNRNEPELTTVTVCYELKNGEKKYRSYPLTSTEIESFAFVYDTEGYKEKAYPLFCKNSLAKEGLTWYDGVIRQPLAFTEDEKEEFLDSYRQDVAQMKMADLSESFPVGIVTVDASISGMKTQAFIYPSYQNTCNILQAHGVEVGKTIADYPVESVRVTTTTATGTGMSGGLSQHFYKDEQEVEEWKGKLLPSDLAVQPLLHPADLQIDAEVRVENPQVNAVEEIWCYGIR